MNQTQLRQAIERETGRALPTAVVFATQRAFRVEGFDDEGVCVFAAGGSAALYSMGLDMHGAAIARATTP